MTLGLDVTAMRCLFCLNDDCEGHSFPTTDELLQGSFEERDDDEHPERALYPAHPEFVVIRLSRRRLCQRRRQLRLSL